MNRNDITLCIVILSLLISCTHREVLPEIDHIDGVHKLATDSLKRQFLEEIVLLDQGVRKEETRILEKYGYDSPEHKASINRLMSADQENLIKIEAYLDVYGYPDPAILGDLASSAPWLVIHHAPGLEPRARNFDAFYQAYKEGHLDDGSFSFYLNRFYHKKFGERIQLESPYRREFELDTLMRSLGLEP